MANRGTLTRLIAGTRPLRADQGDRAQVHSTEKLNRELLPTPCSLSGSRVHGR